MFGITHFGTFALAAFVLIITPGNDTLLILTRSITQGKKAGIISALGVGTGSTIHTLLAAFGLSIIISKSLLVFTMIKYTGAAYLVYTGINMIFSRSNVINNQQAMKPAFQNTPVMLYRRAILTNLLNPKVAMFFIAFLPQFTDASYEYHYLSFIILGLLFTMAGTGWCILLSVFSSRLFVKFNQDSKTAASLVRCGGVVLVMLGTQLAMVKR